MGMLTRFDLSTTFTQFFLVLTVVLVLVGVLMTRIAPKKRRRQRGKVDDRFVNREGQLIE
ncbi:hypothetical protein [Sphingomonas sp.]|jgi:hypothetical protein|uniref:hypothetical protein n=1 Tax=Sphingomonas sp. TaxID=28214 RepID=UPI0035C80D17